MHKKYFPSILLITAALALGSCKKLVEIDDPRGTIPTSAIFTDSASASSGILTMYTKMMGLSIAPNFGSGQVTLYTGQSADELISTTTGDQPFGQNTLAQDNGNLKIAWTDAYSFIYQANICIDGLNASTTIAATTKTQFLAEAKFVRAFFYFYLVNLWGDVPYVTSSDYSLSFGKGRMPAATIYNNIVADLLYAQAELPAAYPAAGKVRPIRLAATALLARVYLYQGEWAKAEASASAVISSGIIPAALSSPANSFLKNSDEAIWQLMPVNAGYVTLEGYQLLSFGTGNIPYYIMQTSLLNSFETGDTRYTNWVKSAISTAAPITTNYYPYKYKVRGGTPVTEYYTMLRLAEQYLIRAEARARLVKVPDAVSDVNVIRTRAGLIGLATTLTQDQAYAAIAQERRIEFFAEWGHRWLDLKRTGKADAVLAPLKPKWKPTAVLYPIPITELMVDPSLTQNEGYQ